MGKMAELWQHQEDLKEGFSQFVQDNIFVDDAGIIKWRSYYKKDIPIASCEMALVVLSWLGYKKGYGYSRFDKAVAFELIYKVVKLGGLDARDLAYIQRTKPYSTYNGLLYKYRRQLKELGYNMDLLLHQEVVH